MPNLGVPNPPINRFFQLLRSNERHASLIRKAKVNIPFCERLSCVLVSCVGDSGALDLG